MRQYIKDPQSVLDYQIDWSDWLDTDTINTSVWAADSGITIDSSSNTTTTTTVWLSGGTDGSLYLLTNTITTVDGRTAERSFVVKVTELSTAIVTRQQAMDHLRIDDADDEADDLDIKIFAASAVVLDYIEATASDYLVEDKYNWPYQLQAATLLLIGDMHRYRDSSMTSYNEASLPAAVRALLYPLKTWGLESD